MSTPAALAVHVDAIDVTLELPADDVRPNPATASITPTTPFADDDDDGLANTALFVTIHPKL
jgi:hypothetical protein